MNHEQIQEKITKSFRNDNDIKFVRVDENKKMIYVIDKENKEHIIDIF